MTDDLATSRLADVIAGVYDYDAEIALRVARYLRRLQELEAHRGWG